MHIACTEMSLNTSIKRAINSTEVNKKSSRWNANFFDAWTNCRLEIVQAVLFTIYLAAIDWKKE